MEYELSVEQNSTMPLISSFAYTLSWLLPVVEIIIAIILFVPKTKLLGIYMGTVLMVLFSGYVAYIMIYNSSLPCTCGGFIRELSWPQHLIFNSVFVLLGVTAILLNKKLFSKISGSKLSHSNFNNV